MRNDVVFLREKIYHALLIPGNGLAIFGPKIRHRSFFRPVSSLDRLRRWSGKSSAITAKVLSKGEKDPGTSNYLESQSTSENGYKYLFSL